jgi:hypothetical protein
MKLLSLLGIEAHRERRKSDIRIIAKDVLRKYSKEINIVCMRVNYTYSYSQG